MKFTQALWTTYEFVSEVFPSLPDALELRPEGGGASIGVGFCNAREGPYQCSCSRAEVSWSYRQYILRASTYSRDSSHINLQRKLTVKFIDAPIRSTRDYIAAKATLCRIFGLEEVLSVPKNAY